MEGYSNSLSCLAQAKKIRKAKFHLNISHIMLSLNNMMTWGVKQNILTKF